MNIVEYRNFNTLIKMLLSDENLNNTNRMIRKNPSYNKTDAFPSYLKSVERLFSIRPIEAPLYPLKYHGDSSIEKEIITVLQRALSDVSSNNLHSFLESMQDIVIYTEYCGLDDNETIWKSIQDDLDNINSGMAKFEELNQQSRVLFSRLREQQSKLDETNVLISTRLERIQQLQIEGESFRSEISKNNLDLSKIKSELTSITDESKRLISDSNSILKQIKIDRESSKIEIERGNAEAYEILKRFNNVENKINDIDEKYLQLLDYENSYKENMSDLNDRFDAIKEKEEYLRDLTGIGVGSKLFETFKQRKEELTSTITFWKWAVPVTVIASIGWIFLVFYLNNSETMNWLVILISSVKSIPALFLMYFAISQFTKERNFQEEYAFKSTVALTIKAYVDQVNDANNKDKVIIDSLNEIYKSPVIYRNTKNKEIEMIKDSKNDVLDIVKKLLDSKKS